jgi:hypothetical protein
MEPDAGRRPTFRFRSRLRWSTVVLWAGLFAVALFTPIDWRGCGFFRYGMMEFAHFGYVFACMVIFFALRIQWRLLLLVVTVPIALFFFGLHGTAEENAGPEASAVAGLRQIQNTLQSYRNEHNQEYPASLPAAKLLPYAQKFYKYEYVASHDTSGETVGYVVQATPKRRDCDFPLSFTIADDDRVFYTYEPRPATTADKILE